MTLGPAEIALYAGALLILFLTPGPVWLAITARALSGGFHAAWPLALGVVVGDVLWPLLAIWGVALLIDLYEPFLEVLRYAGAAMFVLLGVALIRHRNADIAAESRLTAPGIWAGFTAGLLVILGNPKAIFFYMGILPNFFDLGEITGPDIVLICVISALIPLSGNLLLAVFLDRVRALLASRRARARLNLGAGLALVLAGIAIAAT